MCGMKSPQYVRGITFENESGQNVNVDVTFKSG